MNYQDVMNEAKTCMGAYCKVCPVCNGRACKNQMPVLGCERRGRHGDPQLRKMAGDSCQYGYDL